MWGSGEHDNMPQYIVRPPPIKGSILTLRLGIRILRSQKLMVVSLYNIHWDIEIS